MHTFPGCIIEPVPQGLPSIGSLIGAGPLPENYVVPSWRECFEEFEATDAAGVRKTGIRIIPDKVRERILDQGAIDSCVGHGTSVQKSAQEGVKISPRDIFRLAKRLDGYGLEAFGTTLAAAQDALIASGAAEDQLVPRDPAMGRAAYLSLGDVTPQVIESRAAHKSKSAYYVPRTLMRETMVAYGYPLVTSSAWYPEDNAIGIDGIMRPPVSTVWSGHCYAAVLFGNKIVDGLWKQAYGMVNSFGPAWGAHGMFFIPIDGTENRLSNAYVSVDVEPTLAQILAQYNGRNVRVMGQPEHWKIEGGKRRKYPNEIVWWLNGNLFGYDVYDIAATDLLQVPQGADMDIAAVPFKEKERFRQMRAFDGKI